MLTPMTAAFVEGLAALRDRQPVQVVLARAGLLWVLARVDMGAARLVMNARLAEFAPALR